MRIEDLKIIPSPLCPEFARLSFMDRVRTFFGLKAKYRQLVIYMHGSQIFCSPNTAAMLQKAIYDKLRNRAEIN